MRPLQLLATLLVMGCSTMVWQNGVPNLARVDEYVLRGGTPTKAGCVYLHETMHVQKWVKLTYPYEGTGDDCRAAGIDVREFSMPPGDVHDVLLALKPNVLTVINAVVELEDCRTRHIICYVGCLHGQDRTGLVVAIYRVLADGWTKAEAYAEAKAHGFHTSLLGLVYFWKELRI